MIRIRDESDLSNWFKKNYKKIGFSKIIKDNGGRFPDFIMIKDNKTVKVELEVSSSNFTQHKHQISKVDIVVCANKDADLGVPIIEIEKVKLIEWNK
ncbi:MAG: hypothetical protein MUF61_03595, partial [archaeon]|nr:hypothetical protein [archaeon]